MFSKLALGIQRPGLLSNSHRIKYIEVWSFQKNMYWYSVIVVAVKKMLLRGPIYYMYLHVVSYYFCCQKILVEFLNYKPGIEITFILPVDSTVETLYSTIYYSKYFIELHIDKSTQYVALWTHKRHPIPRPFGRAMECLLWVLQQKLIVL